MLLTVLYEGAEGKMLRNFPWRTWEPERGSHSQRRAWREDTGKPSTSCPCKQSWEHWLCWDIARRAGSDTPCCGKTGDGSKLSHAASFPQRHRPSLKTVLVCLIVLCFHTSQRGGGEGGRSEWKRPCVFSVAKVSAIGALLNTWVLPLKGVSCCLWSASRCAWNAARQCHGACYLHGESLQPVEMSTGHKRFTGEKEWVTFCPSQPHEHETNQIVMCYVLSVKRDQRQRIYRMRKS